MNDTQYLSYVTFGKEDFDTETKIIGVIVKNGYEADKILINGYNSLVDIHELTVLDSGKSALIATTLYQQRYGTEVGLENYTTVRIANKGFQEIDLSTGNVLFQWNALDNGVKLTESYITPLDSSSHYWDFL